MNLVELLRHPEGKTLEFKRDLSSVDGFLRTVVAFANTSGGTILIGVEDSSRVRGASEPLALGERIASLVTDSISPRILPDIEILPYRRSHVVAVGIFPSQARPHYLNRAGLPDGVYVRVGSTNRRTDTALLDEMRRFAHGESFDERAMPHVDSEAIDFRAASESFAPVRRIARRDLATLRLTTSHQRRTVPTVGGILLFGRDRLGHFPDAWIQAGRFEGKDKATILDHANLRMPLLPAIDAAIAFVEKHSTRGVDVGRMKRVDRWLLPPAAVRESIVNAVVHADYSQAGAPIRISFFDDRLEVENPGLLPFGLAVTDLPLGVSKVRNRVMARVFNELGLVEQWGSGIQRIISVCRAAGLGAPTFEEVGLRFRVTLPFEAGGIQLPDTVDKAIVALAGTPEGVATRDVAKAIALTPRATRTRLASLVSRGLIREIGTSPRDPRRRYYATERR
jgi:predicted HTH transcriptional regulator